ncbi:MAG: hypothetical protein J0M30_14710 [Chitinophagales bacterium]|nr:hypothetical protein [Chitinophagales bacterium]
MTTSYREGKWNYTEDIQYRVLKVIIKPVESNKMHWQNAFAGKFRQIVEIKHKDYPPFYIDNEDGSGLRKIAKGGGPDSYHADVSDFDFVEFVPQMLWFAWDPMKHKILGIIVDKYQKEVCPEEYEKLKQLQESLIKFKSNPTDYFNKHYKK